MARCFFLLSHLFLDGLVNTGQNTEATVSGSGKPSISDFWKNNQRAKIIKSFYPVLYTPLFTSDIGHC